MSARRACRKDAEDAVRFGADPPKKCTKCNKEKPVTEFSADSHHADGKRSTCKECDSRKWAEYYQKNRSRLRAKKRMYYHEHRDEELARRKKDRDESIDDYRDKEREAKRRLRADRGDAARAYAREYYAANKIRIRLRNRLTRAFRAYSEKGKCASSDEYGVDYQAIIDYLGDPPDSSGRWHIDHIRPLAWFDFDNPEDIRNAFAPENHQWLDAFENRSKGARYES